LKPKAPLETSAAVFVASVLAAFFHVVASLATLRTITAVSNFNPFFTSEWE
jgi:hypothetical protein